MAYVMPEGECIMLYAITPERTCNQYSTGCIARVFRKSLYNHLLPMAMGTIPLKQTPLGPSSCLSCAERGP